jgi:hypothetical protein
MLDTLIDAILLACRLSPMRQANIGVPCRAIASAYTRKA